MKLTAQALLANLPPSNSNHRIVVAYSGGLDSHVLLHSLARLHRQQAGAFQLEALHIHHGVSELADDWVDHCQTVCDELNVPLLVRYVKVDGKQASLENQLRLARYQVFTEVLGQGDFLALAHHADDQAETLMLRMLRGTGPQGLAGMPEERSLGLGKLIRPLLAFSRAELEDYAQESGLCWVDDDSNSDTRFDRNFLRHEVMPKLAERWPCFQTNFERNARVSKDALSSLDYFLERELRPQMSVNESGLDCAWLLGFPAELQINLLRHWITLRGLPLPGYKHLQQVLVEVVSARLDAQSLVSWPGAEVRRFKGVVYANQPMPEHDVRASFDWNISERLQLPGAGTLEAIAGEGGRFTVPEGAQVRVSFRQGGERCRLAGSGFSRLLKKQLNSLQLAPWWRDRLPLIYVNGELAALGDVAICEGFRAAEDQPGYVLRWHKP